MSTTVTCPVCRAAPDQPCARPRGRPHRARTDRATSTANNPKKKGRP